MESKTNLNQERIRSQVLSDALRAEIKGASLDYSRYRANYRNRWEVIDELSRSGFIDHSDGNRYLITFYGLLALKTPEARKTLSDCQKVFNAMLLQYKKHLFEPIAIKQISADDLPPERVLLAALMLNRRSNVSINVQPQPPTVDGTLAGNDRFLGEKTFRGMVKHIREMLAKPPRAERNSPPPLFSGSAANNELFNLLHQLGGARVTELWKSCVERLEKDPAGAITAAKSMLESACKQILDGRGISYTNSVDLPALYSLTSRQIDLDPAKEGDKAVRTILGGCTTVVNGLSELRNALGDSHGKGLSSTRPSHRHSHLAVGVAGAISSFLLATDEGRKRP